MIPDRPRRIQKKEVAAEIGVHPCTLSHLIAGGLNLPPWPCTMAECVGAVRDFVRASKFEQEKPSPSKSGKVPDVESPP